VEAGVDLDIAAPATVSGDPRPERGFVQVHALDQGIRGSVRWLMRAGVPAGSERFVTLDLGDASRRSWEKLNNHRL